MNSTLINGKVEYWSILISYEEPKGKIFQLNL